MKNLLSKSVTRMFASDNSGETTIRMALLLGGVAIAAAVVSAPLLDRASQTYAENGAFGIDRVLTGSIEKSKRYTIRKSVLEEEPTLVCGNANEPDC